MVRTGRPRKTDDLTGKKFGKLTVLAISERRKYGQYIWKCLCDCGNIHYITRGSLTRKDRATKTCGCYSQIKPETPINSAFGACKTGARVRNIVFNITFDDWYNIVQKPCHYCASAPSNTMRVGRQSFVYNGLDRLDNAVGYEQYNVVPCCKRCNIAKHKMSYSEFIDHIRKIYIHSVNRSTVFYAKN
jgi:hypothetical protein